MVAFGIVILLFAVITYTLLIESFHNYYYEDIYRVLEDNDSKNKVITNVDEFIYNEDDNRSIEYLYWVRLKEQIVRKTGKHSSNLSQDIIRQIEHQINIQVKPSKRYIIEIDGRKMFYVITRHPLDRRNIRKGSLYKVALRWEPVDNILQKQLFNQLGVGLVIAMLAMLAVFFFLSSYITRPLIQLTNNVKRISKRKFDKPIVINRKDEIGFLANTIEDMRKELLSYDEEQKLKLHSISHELKTPIMVVQSYIDAMKKGLYPKGTQEASLNIIEEECNRLQKLVLDLLYIQRLDYYDSEIKNKDKINLKEVIQEVINNLVFKIEDISVNLNLDNIIIIGDYNQLKIVIENLMSNQIRYAHSTITITLKKENKHIYLEFYNDGEPLENNDEIFNMFKKGKKGQSGLGLYIVKRLLTINNGSIKAFNDNDGVYFLITWNI
jgi:two-component system sensor histidine kinase CssS